MAENTSILKHEHPLYQWIALVAAVALVFALAGWAILANQDASDAVIVGSAQATDTQTSTEKADVASKNAKVIDNEVTAINKEINSVSSDDFSDTKLDNTSLGL